MAVNNNEYFENYLTKMSDPSITFKEKVDLSHEYNKRYFDSKDKSNISYKFMREFLRINPSIGNPNDSQFEPEEFIKALSIINSTEKGNIKFLYFLNILMKASKDILPVYPEEFMFKVRHLEKSMDLIIKYGIDNGMIKIDEKDMDIISKISSVDHTEAAMEAEKETSKDKKEEDKKKKEEKKKKNEENRKNTEKYFNYNSINQVAPDLKDNKAAWYRVANRVATLLTQEEVQKLIGDQKFRLLIYHDGNDFAIINDLNNDINQEYNIFWFKEKEAERYTDSNLFNMKWAEAHQDDLNKFTA